MTDERAIRRIEELLVEITRLGGQNERTSIVSNLTVVDAAPTGLTNFITIEDERDGDTILAKTVPGTIYAVSDKVNVLFVEGTEPIAFQHGSESPSSGLWGIVPSTSTDIFYNGGDVGIGKAVAPNASLEILDTAQAQLRLTHTEDTKFVDFTLDTNHDLTITPSSTGQVIFQPTTDSTDFFQVLDVDGGTPVVNIDSTNEVFSINTASPLYTSEGTSITPHSYIERSDAGAKRGAVFSSISSTALRTAQNEFLKARAASTALADADRVGDFFWAGHDGTDYNRSARFGAIVDGAVAANAVPMAIVFDTSPTQSAGLAERMRIDPNGDVGIGTNNPLAQLHVDQPGAANARPVLILDQADVSEEMIEFVSTIGVGNAIEAVGAKTLTVTHFIKVTLPGSLTRYIEVGTIA